MQQRPWGSTQYPVPVIGQGTWYIERADRSEAVATLRRGLDLGMTHIDTAEMYGSGEAERIVGEAIAGRRDEVFVVSKVLPQNATRAGTRTACERSLTRLKTDRLDCYLLHWRGQHPLDDTIAGLEDLQRAGKIRSWGVSNFDVPDLEALSAIDADMKCSCNQVLYNLKERAVEHAVLPWCEAHRIAVVAYSPFGHDRFPSPRTPEGSLLAQIADARGSTPRQVALAFLTRHRSIFAIPKASSIGHAEENAGAGDISLSQQEIERIETAFPLGRRPKGLPMI
jgi:diketogulonate reductase-like aldo/keto reductase